MKEFKFKTTFASKISPMISEDKDKYLALASKDTLSKYFPKEINFNDNVGFQGFVGEAFIANKLNLNSDGVKTEEAIKIADMFPFTYCDINHSRKNVVGVIATASFAEYGSGKPLTKDEVSKMKSPFSVVIGGIVWRAPNPEFADAVENANDPSSEFFEKLFLSWELAFDDYDLIIIDAKKTNLEDGTIITDKDEIKKLSEKLQAYGGTGLTEDGKKIGRIPMNDICPLGVGIVENPAGQVSPIKIMEDPIKQTVANNTTNTEDLLIKLIKEQIILLNSENKISQAKEVVVNQDIDNIANNKSNMKIEKFEQLTDENLKEIKSVSELKEIFASSTKEVLDTKIKEISKDYVSQIAKKDGDIQAAQDSVTKLTASVEEITKKFTKASEDLIKLQEESKQREQLETLATRMAAIENDFDLDDKQKEIVASKVKTCATEDDFKNYLAEIEVLLAAKKKSKKMPVPPADDKKDSSKADDDDASKKQSNASIDANVLDEAIKNGIKKDGDIIPNAAAGTESILDRAKKAFGPDGWTVTNKRKNRI